MTKTPLTKEGAERIHDELARLKNEERRKISAEIAEARAHGDLKENAEYHAAKEKQGFLEGRIRHLESMVADAQIIDVTSMKNDGKVVFGSTVVLCNIDTEEKVRYTIVGEDEADLKHGKISYQSPIARAVIGKMQGDEVLVSAPSGEIEYEIEEVLYI